MFDLSGKITSFSDGTPATSGAIFRPVKQSWLSHVAFEEVEVEVDLWNTAAGTTRSCVAMSEAMKMAEALAKQGMRVERWGWMG